MTTRMSAIRAACSKLDGSPAKTVRLESPATTLLLNEIVLL